MSNLFIAILNNTLAASWLILAVVVLRLIFHKFLKKTPKWVNCLLWGIVALKLVLPIEIESIFSLIPNAKPVPADIEYAKIPQIDSGISVVNSVVNPVLENNFAASEMASMNPIQGVIIIASYIWAAGVIGFIVYSLVSSYLINRQVKNSRLIEKGIFESENIVSPFILGVIRPRIYIPDFLDEDEYTCVIEHEKAHIRRGDFVWKPLGFLILSVYWFNPLCWAAYICLCKDIEYACDEKVTKDKDRDWKAKYCQVLLNCSAQRRMISACPVAFGEVSVKERIRSVINYKRPGFWAISLAIVICIIVSVGFLTNPKNNENQIVNELPTEENLERQEALEDELKLAEEQAKLEDELKLAEEQAKLEALGSDYTDDLIFNFAGEYYSSEDYVEPAHGDGTPKGWYALGGEGQCIDPYYKDLEVFMDGKLTGYLWLDNHSRNVKIVDFTVGEYSCVLYKYSFDLFTVAELEKIKEPVKSISEYWAVFYTKGVGEPLYLKYFSCDYFNQDQAMESIAPGVAIMLPSHMNEENMGVSYRENPITHEYLVDGDMVLKYKKYLVGKDADMQHSIQYIVLTNDETITWEQVYKSFISSNSEDWLPGTIIIGMNTLD